MPPWVSSAFVVPNDPAWSWVKETLATVDRVHTDGHLPRIPIYARITFPGADGQYRYKRGTGTAQGIGISPAGPNPELTLLHEIGHFLDHQSLGNRGGFASIRHPLLVDWRLAVDATETVRRLRQAQIDSGWTDSMTGASRYLLEYPELWARSYAQYIAIMTADVQLFDQINQIRAQHDRPFNLSPWPDLEFVPIQHAIDALFGLKGWQP